MRIRKRPATLFPPHFPAAPCPPSTPHDLAPACLILQTPSQPFHLDLGACRRVHDGIRKRLRVDHEDLDREKEDDVEGLPSNSYPDQERNHAVSVGAGHIAAESFRPRARTMVAAGRHRPHDEAAPFSSAVVPVPAGLVCLSSTASDDDDDRKPKSCPANNSILQGQAEDASKMLQQSKVQVKSMQGGPVRRSCGAQIACRTVHDAMREEVQEVIIESWRRGRQPASSSQCAPQVGMPTTSGAAPQLRKDQTSISPTCKWDHAMKYVDVEWPYHEDSGQALQRLAGGRIQDLQGLCRPLRESGRMCMKSPSWEQDNDMEMGIHELEGGSEKSDRRNYMGSSTVVNNEEKLKKAGGGDDEGEQQRCGRRSGRGWQCKNMRAVGSQTIYCDHHRLKIFEHHATWNARNKLMKKKKSSTSMKIGGSKKPHQNMVNINASASTEVVLNHDMENNMHVGGSNSSECCLPDINIFERVLQASQRVKKRRMRRHPRCTASMAFLPNLVETFVPTSPQAHQPEESGPHQGGPGLNLRGFQNMTSSWGVERPEYNTLMVVDDDNGAAGTMSITHHDDSDGDNDAAGSRGVTHHDDGDGDGDMVAKDEERCRRVDGRGWRCKKMRAKDGRNSMYCEHHRAKLREHHEKRSLIRSRERRRGRRSMCNPSRGGGGGGVGNSAGAVGAGAVGSKTSGVHGEGGFHNSSDGGESDEDGDHDEEGSKGQQPLRCGRMDGRGWQCKHMRAKGSIYCEHHGAKLRENHATWNARKRQLSSERQRGEKEASLDFHKLRAMATTMKEEATPPRRRCPKMRSLQDIQQAHVIVSPCFVPR